MTDSQEGASVRQSLSTRRLGVSTGSAPFPDSGPKQKTKCKIVTLFILVPVLFLTILMSHLRSQSQYFPVTFMEMKSTGAAEVKETSATPTVFMKFHFTETTSSYVLKSSVSKTGQSAVSVSKNKSKANSNGRTVLSVKNNQSPFNFLKQYRNPCWLTTQKGNGTKRHRGKTKEEKRTVLACLPYFYLAGFPKCGTTDLYRRLIMHPDILAAPGKEPHWITRNRYRGRKSELNAYTSFFATPLKKIDAENMTYIPYVVGDGSASTFWDNQHFRKIPGNENCSEPCVIHADYIRYLNPNVKIIVILRNPTDRLYSDHTYFVKTDKYDFHNRTARTVTGMRRCLKNYTLRYCAYVFRQWQGCRLNIGLYHVYLEDWLLRFPRDQIHVMRLETMKTNATQEMKSVFTFLGLDQPVPKTMKNIVSAKKANVGKIKAARGPMLPETKALLDEFYQPYNERLAKLLQDDRYLWQDDTR